MTNGIVDGHLNEDQQSMLADRPLSGIMSTTSSRPSTSATIVHVHSQPPVKIMPAVHRDPSFIKSRSSAPLPNSNSVVFHENPTSYHTIIKVLTRLTPQFFQIILANTTNVIQGQAPKIISLFFFIQVQF